MSLLAHFPLNGDAKDVTGRYSGTPVNINWIDGKVGKASSAANASSRIEIPAISHLTTFSVALWHRSSSSGNTTYRTILGTNANIHPIICLSKIQLGVWDGSNKSFGYSFTPDVWTHIVVIFKTLETKADLYVNGVYYSSVSTIYKPSVNPITALGGAVGQSYGAGDNDDFRIYDGVITEREIRDLAMAKVAHYKFTNGSLKDCSGNGLDLQLTTSPTVVLNPIVDSIRGEGYERPAENNGSVFLVSNDEILLDDEFTFSSWLFVNQAGTSANGVVTTHDIGKLAGSGITLKYITPTDIRLSCNTGNGTARTYNTYYSTSNIYKQWAHCVVRYKGGQYTLWVNGVLESTGTLVQKNVPEVLSIFKWANNYTSNTYLPAVKLTDVRVYNTGISDDDIVRIYRNSVDMDRDGGINSYKINESGLVNTNLINYTTWKLGMLSPAPVGFSLNGLAVENYGVLGEDPWGKEITLWEGVPSGDSNGDGGWVTTIPAASIDKTKMYRHSVWVRKTVSGNGSTYLGCQGTVNQRSTNVLNTNPYFWLGTLQNTIPGDPNGWVLIVGHIWPVDSGAGANHPDSGLHSVQHGKLINANDFIMIPTTTVLTHRAYLFYSTNVTTRQQFAYPRVDLVDGTEPSVSALLGGFDSRNYDLIHYGLKSSLLHHDLAVSYEGISVGEINEVDITGTANTQLSKARMSTKEFIEV